MVVDIQKVAGSDSVAKLMVILCIDEDKEQLVREMLMKHSFYGLNPENIMMMKIPTYSGACHDTVVELTLFFRMQKMRFSAST